MNESSIDWILAIACFLAGIGIGALFYHLLNANVARNQKVRQRLAETELELNQVKDGLNDHFAKITDLASSIQRQSLELEHYLIQGTDRIAEDSKVKQRTSEALEDGSDKLEEPAAPRDYAEGNQGTLAEDYGVRQRREDPEPQQPPRY